MNDNDLLNQAVHSITHFGDDPFVDYGIVGGIIGAVAGMVYAVVSGKLNDNSAVTLDDDEYTCQ